MPKFSIIIPVYNTEKYFNKCLDSVINQSYKDYEVIIINDGSTDSSEDIINNYSKENNKIKYYFKKNGGLSSARNYGVSKSKGEYIIFLDSDDYLDKNILRVLNDNIEDNIDIIRFQSYRVFDDKKEDYLICPSFNSTNGKDAFLKLYKNKSIELATVYLFNKKYWDKNQYEFAINRYHEDFGLIPLVILKAKKVKSIDYKGYYYVDRPNSITTDKNYEKIKKRAFDMLFHFDFLLKESRKANIDEGIQRIFESFISNSLITKINDLNKNDKKSYIIELKKRKVIDLILNDNIKRKLKKIILKIKFNL